MKKILNKNPKKSQNLGENSIELEILKSMKGIVRQTDPLLLNCLIRIYISLHSRFVTVPTVLKWIVFLIFTLKM